MHRISCLKSMLTFLTPDEQMKSIYTNMVYFQDKIVIYFLHFGQFRNFIIGGLSSDYFNNCEVVFLNQ